MKRKVAVADFEPLGIPEGLEGLTAKLLFDLFDIATKWGRHRKDRMMTFPAMGILAMGKGKGFIIAAHPQNVGLFICKSSTELGAGYFSTEEGAFLVGIKKGGGVIWDKRITVDEAEATVRGIDAIFKKKGYLDPHTGERVLSKIIEIEPVSYKVSEMFANTSPIFLVPSDIPETAEEVLQWFDHPELLGLVDAEPFKIICLKERRRLFKVRERVIKEIMEKKNIRTMSLEEFFGLKKEIGEEIERRLKE